MQELIKYFEAIEARLAVLEAKEQMLQSKEQSLQTWEERLQRLEKAQQENMIKLQAVGTHVNTMLQTLKALETRQSEAVHVAAPMPAPQPIVEEVKLEEPTPQPKAEEVKVEEVKVEEPAPQPKAEEVKEEEVKAEEPRVEEVAPKASIYGKAVTDIRQAISIGDRFLYQRELFAQNAELMQRTLNELDQLHSFAEAMDYINMRFQWDQESNTYQQFIVTLHRRFG